MARRFPTGMRVKDLRVGTGQVAAKGKYALIHFDCFLPRGERLATSRERPHPVQFEIGQRRVSLAVDLGVVGMAVGGIRQVTVSPQLTHVEQKTFADLPAKVALRYEIELVDLSDVRNSSTAEGP